MNNPKLGTIMQEYHQWSIEAVERLYIPKSTIKALIEAAKILNLELHGREDCKSCALMEQLEEML